jgi:hypothetical protein
MSFIYGSRRLDNQLAQYQNTLIIIIGTKPLAAAVLQLKKMMAAPANTRYSKKID